MTIHSKSGISWKEKSADDLEFSAEGLSGKAKTTKFALLEEPALQFVTSINQITLSKNVWSHTSVELFHVDDNEIMMNGGGCNNLMMMMKVGGCDDDDDDICIHKC